MHHNDLGHLKPKITPKVSIGMPVYNGELYLRDAFESLLGQNFKDFELVVSDNASTDITLNICKEYAALDNRIKYIRQSTNIGALENFTFVLRESKGQYFMWAASDDIWDKDFLSTLVDAMDAGESILGFCPCIRIAHDGKTFGVPRTIDYSSASVVLQLYKFLIKYDDGCYYGLYRRESLLSIRFPVWWSINRGTPMNCAYPPLFFILSSGRFVFSGTSPLWFNRSHDNHNYHDEPQVSNGYLLYLAFALRKINVMFECARSVLQGSKSSFVTALILPGLIVRCFYDIVNPLFARLPAYLDRFLRRIYVK